MVVFARELLGSLEDQEPRCGAAELLGHGTPHEPNAMIKLT